MNSGNFDTKVLPLKERIFRFARSLLCDGAEAEDVTQDVLEKLWLRRDTLPYGGNIEAFVYTTTRNLCFDHVRRHKTRRAAAASLAQTAQGQRDDTAGFEIRDMKRLAEKAIAALPEKQQMVIHLRDVEGCEFDEIAEITGMEEPTARVMLSRARKAVREVLIKATDYGT